MEPLVFLIDTLVNLYLVVLLARVLLPLFGLSPHHPVVQWTMRLTEPILSPIRSVLPRVGMLDFSPLVAMILLNVLQSILVALITG